MKKFCSFVVAGLFALSMSQSAHAQSPNDKWLIGVGAHSVDFRAVRPAFSQFFKTERWETTAPLSRIWVARNLHPRLNAQVSASVGEKDNDRWGIKDEFFLDLDAGVQLRIGNDKGVFKYFDPYIIADLGYTNYCYCDAKYGLGGNEYIYKDLKDAKTLRSSHYKADTENFFTAGGGLGFNVWLTDKFGVNYQGQYKHMLNGKRDYQDYFLHSFGLVFRFGSKDTDGDGIIDKKDACPEVAGLAAYDGCPDSDSDGIIDSKDDCPNTPGLADFNGCPDSDGDGIPDKNDNCPDEAGPEDNGGCPIRDRDGDGIPDAEDQCPDKPGIAEQNGCPKIVQEEIVDINKKLSAVFFDFGKASIKPTSLPVLGEVATFILAHPTYDFWVKGYTDSIGSTSVNQKLSQRRAEAVVKYLTGQGVPAGQLKARGFGEKNPIASNKTKSGRAKNRRVEVAVIQ